MPRQKKSHNVQYAIAGSIVVIVGAAFAGWNSRPDTSVYDNWPVSGAGYMISISADITVPASTSIDERVADVRKEVHDRQPSIQPVNDMEQAQSEEKRAKIGTVIERDTLRLSGSEDIPKTEFATTMENPYLTTD